MRIASRIGTSFEKHKEIKDDNIMYYRLKGQNKICHVREHTKR